MTSALFVSHTGEKGGAEIFLADLIIAGPKEWRACFLSAGDAADELSKRGRHPVMLKAGNKMLAIRRNSSFLSLVVGAVDVLKVAWQLSREARKYDVLCANSQKALFVCAIAAVLSRKPLVWILHDIVTDPAFSRFNRCASIMFARLFSRLVAVNSQATGRAFVEAGGEPGKVRLVYNGFDSDAAPAPTAGRLAVLRQKLGLDERPIVGLFGRLSEWKGQHVLLEALAINDGIQAIIVGGPLFGQEAYEADIRRMSVRLGLERRVRFLGFRTDILELMASVDIVVHTSIVAEPFGRVVVEGMLAERPIIATRGGGINEIVQHENTGILVPPGDAQALSEAMRRLAEDRELAARLAVNGRKDASERFSISASCARIKSVLEEAGSL